MLAPSPIDRTGSPAADMDAGLLGMSGADFSDCAGQMAMLFDNAPA